MSAVPKFLTLRLEHVMCCMTKCDALIVLPERAMNDLRDNHKLFYCYHGHPQSFQGPSDATKLRRELATMTKSLKNSRKHHEWTKQDLKHEKASASALRGVVTRTKNRIKNGVCPCCNRYFKNLHKHMTGQHPDYVKV